MGSAGQAKRLKKREQRRLRAKPEAGVSYYIPEHPAIMKVTAEEVDRAWWIGDRIAEETEKTLSQDEFFERMDRDCRRAWPSNDASRALAAAARARMLRNFSNHIPEIDINDEKVIEACAVFPMIWTEPTKPADFLEYLGISPGGSAPIEPVPLFAPPGE
jgi:hypothetical protein